VTAAVLEAEQLAREAYSHGRRLDRRWASAIVGSAVVLGVASLFGVAFLSPSGWRSVIAAFAAVFIAATTLAVCALVFGRRSRVAPVIGRLPRRAPAREVVAASVSVGALAFGITVASALSGPGEPESVASNAPLAPLSAPIPGRESSVAAPPSVKPEVTPERARPSGDVNRRGKDAVGPGQLYVPESFAASGEPFDVVVHFHGHADVVVDSVALAGLNAVVVVVNMKKGSKYHEYFQDPAALPALLDQVQTQMEERGLDGARVGRVALSSFSSGSGALTTILNAPGGSERVDAVVILDGLHVRWADESRTRVDPNEISPLVRFASAARDGKGLFVITHSNAKAIEHANAGAVADAILVATGVDRAADRTSPRPVEVDGAAKLFHDGKIQRLEGGTRTQMGGLHILGFENRAPGHQPAHLVQMSATALPLLVDRWAKR
jgi:hypothetical protein